MDSNSRRPNFTAVPGNAAVAAEGRGPASPLPLAGHFIVCGAEVRGFAWGECGLAEAACRVAVHACALPHRPSALPAARHERRQLCCPGPLNTLDLPACLASAPTAGVVCPVCGAAAQVRAARNAHCHPAPHAARGECACGLGSLCIGGPCACVLMLWAFCACWLVCVVHANPVIACRMRPAPPMPACPLLLPNGCCRQASDSGRSPLFPSLFNTARAFATMMRLLPDSRKCGICQMQRARGRCTLWRGPPLRQPACGRLAPLPLAP